MQEQDITRQAESAPTVADLNAALEESITRYRQRTPNSAAAIAAASEVMPGGLTRSVLQYDPYPLVIEQTEGARIRCADGHEYLDYVGDYSAGIFGHSNPNIMAAIQTALKGGLSYGAPHRHEMALAKHLVERFPAFEKVQFANSGTEANLGVLKTARAFTGRDAILVFEDNYHGGVLGFAAGYQRDNAPYDFIIGQYNNMEATLAAVGHRAGELAAILIEPVMGAGGGIQADRSFLQALQQLANDSGALLVFDEVMTSRHGPAGMQGMLGITPDLCSMGKYIGGGFAFGCFGGRADVMDVFTPQGSIGRTAANSGTFNNHVITSQVGLVGLRDVYTPEVATAFFERGNAFRQRLNSIIAEQGVKAQVIGLGSVMGVHFFEGEIRGPAALKAVRDASRALFYFEMLARGFYTVRRGGMILSLALNEENDDAFCEAFSDVLATYGHLLSV